tara:strand:+ start:68 stop:448 length:381 start_codon:yes stop_codon:yes gene_type:complete
MLVENRRLSNMKQNTILDINYYPSGKSVPEGDILISHPKGRPLRLYKKLKGMLWWIDFTRDGNEYVDKNLEVNGNIKSRGNIKCGGTFKSSDDTEGLTDTISFVDNDSDTHGITIKDGLITSWNIS